MTSPSKSTQPLARLAAVFVLLRALAACQTSEPSLRQAPQLLQPTTALELAEWPTSDALELRLRIALRQGQAAAAVDLSDAATDTHLLVWRHGHNGLQTLWVRMDASPDALRGANRAADQSGLPVGIPGAVLGQRQGLWLLGREGLYHWQEQLRRVRTCDPVACAEQDGLCVPVMQRSGPFQGRILDVRLQPLGGRLHTGQPVGPKLSDQLAVALGSPGLHHQLLPLGQLGDQFLAQARTETWSCGAMQGRTATVDYAVVVPDGLLVPPLLPADRQDLAQRHEASLRLLRELEPARPAGTVAPLLTPQTLQIQLTEAGWQAAVVFGPVQALGLAGAGVGALDLADTPTPTQPERYAVPVEAWPERLAATWDLRPPVAILPALPAVKRPPTAPDRPLYAGFGQVRRQGAALAELLLAFQTAR
jgi:hypothetical protein